MNPAAAAVLQLVRLPNLFTAMADILAGAALTAWGGWQPLPLLTLLFASSALYGGGCALNDWCDRNEDAAQRPNRPIPSGRISPAMAFAIALLLLLTGTGAALIAGRRSGLVALALLLLIVVYDCRAKKRPLPGALAMGGCRGFNLLLGMSVAPLTPGLLIFPACSFLYVAILTVVADRETAPDAARTAGWVLGVLAGAATVGATLIARGLLRLDSAPFLLGFAALTLPPLYRAGRGEHGLRPAVRQLILGIVLLDAFYAASIRGAAAGLLVLSLLAPALWLGKKFSMT
ncbi:MAG: UbiA family prenyltransferase [Thermodesulfobacteriota bacterium]